MRFIGALEELLDPIVAVLDALPAHFDPDHAPRDILNLLAAWLGVDLDESQEIRHQREMVRRAAELGRRRGTVRRARARARASPSRTCRCGSRTRAACAGRSTSTPVDAPPPSFIVYCDKPVPEEVQAGDRALHRAVQAGRNVLPPEGEGTEEERHVMRTCQSCGRQNPPDRDFCECGEYLRWEPTGYVQAITPEMAAQAAAEAAAPAAETPAAQAPPPPAAAPAPAPAAPQPQEPVVTQRPAARAAAGPWPRKREWQRSDNRRPARRKCDRAASAAAQPPAAPARRPPSSRPCRSRPRRRRSPPGRAEPETARITLRMPDGEADNEQRSGSRSSPASATASWRWSATRARSSTTTSCASRGCPTTGGRSTPTPSTSSRSAPAAPTSRRWRSTSTRRARPRPRRKLWDLQVVAHSKAQSAHRGLRASSGW